MRFEGPTTNVSSAEKRRAFVEGAAGLAAIQTALTVGKRKKHSPLRAAGRLPLSRRAAVDGSSGFRGRFRRCCGATARERRIDSELNSHGLSQGLRPGRLDLAAERSANPILKEQVGHFDHHGLPFDAQPRMRGEPEIEPLLPHFVGQACPQGRYDFLIVHGTSCARCTDGFGATRERHRIHCVKNPGSRAKLCGRAEEKSAKARPKKLVASSSSRF